MSSNESFKRRQYVVDWRLQTIIPVQLLGVLVGIAALYVIGVFVLPGEDKVSELPRDEMYDAFVRANLIYFGLAAAILVTFSIFIMHRIAGPAFVLRRAVDGVRAGLYHHRLGLRRGDYLKELAQSVQGLCEDLATRDKAQMETVVDLERCLAEGDTAAAKELLEQLKVSVVRSEDEPGAEAPSETAETVPVVEKTAS